jgi:hypothetical protein
MRKHIAAAHSLSTISLHHLVARPQSCYVQSFFSTFHRRFFAVSKPTHATTAVVQDAAAILAEYQAFLGLHSNTTSEISEQIKRGDDSAWLRRTG